MTVCWKSVYQAHMRSTLLDMGLYRVARSIRTYTRRCLRKAPMGSLGPRTSILETNRQETNLHPAYHMHSRSFKDLVLSLAVVQ